MEASQSGTPENVQPNDPNEGERADVTQEQEAQAQDPNATQGETITGDQGEQIPADATGADPNRPVRQSAPPAEAQSGVPLQEDREAGVEPQPQYAGGTGTGSAEGEATPANPTEGGSAVTNAGEQPAE